MSPGREGAAWPPAGVAVEVIIPVFNDAECLQLCLAALAHQAIPADRFVVTVVDNGSDQPLELPQLPYTARLLRCPQPGSYAARNTAIAASQAELMAFTDADCLPAPDWLAQGLRLADAHTLLAGAIRIRPSDAAVPTPADRYELLFGMQQQHYVQAGGFGITANLWVPRRLLEQIGPFNAALKSGGDREFCLRARHQGWPLLYAAGCVVEHPARCSEQLVAKARRLVGGRLDRAGQDPALRLLALLLHLKPMLREVLIAMRAPMACQDKARLLTLVLRLRLVAVAEWWRLCFGGGVSRR